jgi:hypothetical protein
METPSTRLLLTIPFAVPADWTPEQAVAVVKLLDDLRALIWAHYGQQLLDEISDGQMSGDANQSASSSDDPPFCAQQIFQRVREDGYRGGSSDYVVSDEAAAFIADAMMQHALQFESTHFAQIRRHYQSIAPERDDEHEYADLFGNSRLSVDGCQD